MQKTNQILTAEVMFIKCEAKVECWNWRPTTAAGALWPLCSTKTAWVAVTKGLFWISASKGTENTKLSGSIVCWWTALLYHSSSMALLFVSLKCLIILTKFIFELSNTECSSDGESTQLCTYGTERSGGEFPCSFHLSKPLLVATNEVVTPNIWYPCLHEKLIKSVRLISWIRIKSQIEPRRTTAELKKVKNLRQLAASPDRFADSST